MRRLLLFSLPHLLAAAWLWSAAPKDATLYWTVLAASLLGLWTWASASVAAPILGPCRNRVETDAPCFALTYDDGPGPHTGALLDLLARHGASATFFVVGAKAQAQPELLQRMAAEGHELANHSMRHQVRASFSAARLRADLSACQQVVTAAGLPAPTRFRPPCGVRTHATHQVAAELGLEVCGWSVGGGDGGRRPVEGLAQQLGAGLSAGAVVLLHDGLEDRERLLSLSESLLQQAAQKGLQARSLARCTQA